MFLVESLQKDDYTEIVVFSRDEKKQKHIKHVKNFRPYFYVLEDAVVPESNKITEIETGHVSLTGEKVKKIYTKTSKDILDLRDMFDKTFEADVRFTNRYIINEIGEQETYPLKVLYFDIELNTENVFPDMKVPDQEVVSIAMIDNFENREKFLLLRSPEWKKNGIEVKDDEITKVFDTEQHLLSYFITMVKEYDPDILSGWNVEKFDLLYLIRRMSLLEIDYKEMSPLYSVYIGKRYEDVNIKGRIVLDMMGAYKQFRKMSNQGRAESYSLEYTAQSLLGIGKVKHKETFRELWNKNPDKLKEYNLRDNRLVKDIEDSQDIIRFYNSIRSKACAQLINIYHATQLIDGILLRACLNKIVLPSGDKYASDATYSGAHVFYPIPGVYFNVLGLDIKSMYPNIIKTFNMGYETYNPDGEIKVSNGAGFNRGIGLISEMLRGLEKERNKYKKLMHEAYENNDEKGRKANHYRQYAVKVLMNSFYGVLGFPKYRLYKKEVADAITTTGREIIQYTAYMLQERGYKILYGDTDSVYVQSKETEHLKILTEGYKLLKVINNGYKQFALERGATESTLIMQFEKTLKAVLFVAKKGEKVGAKKKYAYLPGWIDGKDAKDKVEFTGFETVRSDTPRIARVAQKEVVDMILHKATKEEVDSYLKNLDTKIRKGEISPEEYGFPKGISKKIKTYGKEKDIGGATIKVGEPPIIKGAKYSNKYLGTRFGEGSKPKWIYIKAVPPGYPKTEVLAYEDEIPDGFIPDFDRINERLFKMKLESIYEAAGWGDFPNLNAAQQKLTF